MDTQPSKRRKLEDSRSHIGSRDAYTETFEPTAPVSSTIRNPSGLKTSTYISSRPSQPAATMYSDGSYHSNIFKLQLGELIKKITPKYETQTIHAEKALHRLRDIIEHIPDREGLPVSDAQKAFQTSSDVRIPFPDPGADPPSKLLLGYSNPANIHVVGSFARKTTLLLDGRMTIDVAVVMPSHLFQAKDYRDYRYFRKRAYYLACIADGIHKATASPFAVSFEYQDDNPLQPILVVEPPQGSQQKPPVRSNYRIRILLAASNDLFPIQKTLPTEACVRKSTLDIHDQVPSPMYNATLRSECSSLASLKSLQHSLAQSDGFRDACVLGAVWLRQRGLGSSISKGGFGQFEWASVVSMLMQGGGRANRPVLSSRYSSYQLFKATLHFLAATDLSASPMIFHSTDLKFASSNHPVFFDGSRGLNLLFKMSPWSYEMLRCEAKTSLKAFDDPLVDHFKTLFINKVDEPSSMFDYLFRIPLSERKTDTAETENVLDRAIELANNIYEKLSYGLSDRATLIHPHIPNRTPWPVDSSPSPSYFPPYLAVGLRMNPENSQRTVDRGPSVDDKKASALFRDFWGEKAELRRFKDGAILESVVWDGLEPGQALLNVIIGYMLSRHFNIDDLDFPFRSLESLLPLQTATSTDTLAPFSPVRSAYEALCKSIRDLEGLPLQIRQISAASPELCFSSVSTPLAGQPHTLKWPVEFQIQFEGSTRWPQDIVAVQRTKIAFLLKTAAGLEQEESVAKASLGLETAKHKLPEEPFLDIATPDGIVFRLRIHHEHELKLLEQALHGHTPSPASREELALALSDHKRRYIHTPAHTQAVYTLSTRFPLLSPTIRLLKQWRDAHILSPHLRDQLLDLLAIRTFVHPCPWPVPGSLTSAFARTLAFIAAWDWQTDPLIVDLNNELTKEDVEGIHTRFQAWRNLDPGMNRVALFAASNIDRESGITWTDRARPAKVVAARFTKLARAASQLVKEQGLELDPETLFVPSFTEYDFLIHLKHKHNSKESSYKNLRIEAKKAGGEDPFEGICNPAERFVEELEELYGDCIVFFYNRSGGAGVVAGLWNPQTTGAREWKVGLGYSTMPVSADGDGNGDTEQRSRVAINKEAVLHDIARLGGDLVRRIDGKASS